MCGQALNLLLLVSAFSLPLVEAKCRVAYVGHSDDIILEGTVLTPGGPVQDGHVLIRSGRIARVGRSYRRGDGTIIQCPGSVISPGFINTHEHIAYSTVQPFGATSELYNHRHDWRMGLRGHTMLDTPINGSTNDATAWGELRHIFSGTTSIVGGFMVPGLTRNLDFAAGLEDELLPPDATWNVFPLDDSAGILRNGDCDYGPNAVTQDITGKAYRYMGHVGEGVDAQAENKFKCLSSQTFDTTPLAGGGELSADVIAPNFVLLHALGLTRADFDLVAKREATVVWAPRSNVFLYGQTLDVRYLLDAGTTVALGTDWLPSGSATLGREAVCALFASKKSYHHTLEPRTLWEMMTINAARVAGFDQDLGSIEVGKLADLIIFEGGGARKNPLAQAIYAPSERIQLVMRGGKILLPAQSLAGATGDDCETLQFGDVKKIACVRDELNSTVKAFERSLDDVFSARCTTK
jgi:hypothetical protein